MVAKACTVKEAIVLVCTCDWKGVNLRPNYQRDTAHCPECREMFRGIRAGGAISVSPDDEKEIIQDNAKLVFMCEAVEAHKRRGGIDGGSD